MKKMGPVTALRVFRGSPNLDKLLARSNDAISLIIDILVCGNDCSLGIGVVSDEACDGAVEGWDLRSRVGSDTTPNLTVHPGRVTLQPHPCHNGKLVSTSLEREIKFGLGGLVGVGHSSVGKHNFEVVDIVTSKSLRLVSIGLNRT